MRRSICAIPRSTISIRDDKGLDLLFRYVLNPELEPTTGSMSLIPRDYRPDGLAKPEFPPSNLYFSVDVDHGVAAVALLAFDRDEHSHQWLPRGHAWRPDVADLAMDHTIPSDTPFSRDAYITVDQLREVVAAWAWGAELPPAGVEWREASDREVRWHWLC